MRRNAIAGSLTLAVAIAGGHSPVRAQSFSADFEIGGGATVAPSWEGASRYAAGALPLFRLHHFTIPGLVSLGGPDGGFGIAPSIRLIDERKQSDDKVLAGLGNVDRAYELGARISYRWEAVRAFVELRQGFGGYDGIAGAIGMDVIWQPRERLEIAAGPRLSFAGDGYMRRYFGIDAAQAAASGYQQHDASAGIKGIGFESKATMVLTDHWSLIGKLGYERLIGDAGTSPIVKAGSDDQLTAGMGLSYRLRIAR